jgi:two-component system sensor histidine kinase HydH
MTHDWHLVLCEVIRIVNRPKVDILQGCQDVLNFLKKTFELEEAALFLTENSEGPVTQVIPASGPVVFSPWEKTEPVIEPMVLKSPGTAVRRGRNMYCAAESGRRLAILFLSLPPDFPCVSAFDETVASISLILSNLLDRGPEHGWQGDHLSLLAEFNLKLSQARTMTGLLQTACGMIQNRMAVAGIFLRPLFAGTVHSAPVFRVGAHWRPYASRLADLEERLAARVLDIPGPFARKENIYQDILGDWQGPEVQVFPLILREDSWGVMTLFRDTGAPRQDFSGDQGLLDTMAALIAQAMERVAALEELDSLSAENARKLEEATLLYRISRAIHSTLRLDELMHLTLSAATVQGGPGFERAMLFMVNERSGVLQGMLGVTRETAPMILSEDLQLSAWEGPEVSEEARDAQRKTPFCRQVVKLRLALDPEDNPLAKAVKEERVVFVPIPGSESPSFNAMARALGLAPCACAPLLGRKRVLGVLVVDNPRSGTEITSQRRHFLELFANQAAQAMENCLLLHRLEESHRDLRETQERMIQGEKMAALGETAASVTHELRNPLVAIGGFAQRLSRIAPDDSREKEYSAIIVREVRRMEEMLSNILGFSRKQMLCIADCRIESVIEEALTLEEDALQRSAVNTVCEIAESLPVIHGDEQKLRQVLVNLIGNARQVMSSGGNLTIRAYPTFLRGDQAVAIEVEDTGGGIPPDVMRNIFNPFFTTRESGTGLGLSIVHRIIEHHYGDIEVQNREKGALFIVRLPVDGVPKGIPFR